MKLAFIALLFFNQATWTGRFERVTLYDKSNGVNCQYHTYAPETFFWQAFRGYDCPRFIQAP